MIIALMNDKIMKLHGAIFVVLVGGSSDIQAIRE